MYLACTNSIHLETDSEIFKKDTVRPGCEKKSESLSRTSPYNFSCAKNACYVFAMHCINTLKYVWNIVDSDKHVQQHMLIRIIAVYIWL